jgi:hypothetical protein
MSRPPFRSSQVVSGFLVVLVVVCTVLLLTVGI